MDRDFGNEGVASVSFQYHMYGASMGTVKLAGSDDGGSTYTTLWSKSGNEGNAWFSATVAPGASYQVLKFMYKSGSSFTGDFALDDVVVTIGEHVHESLLFVAHSRIYSRAPVPSLPPPLLPHSPSLLPLHTDTPTSHSPVY